MLDTLVYSDSLYQTNSVREYFLMDSGLYDPSYIYSTTCTMPLQESTIRTFLGMPIEIAAFIVPTIATLIVFILGYVISFFIKQYNKKKENQRYRDCIYEWIALLEKPIQKQIENLHELAQRINLSDTLQPEAFIWSKSLVDKLNDISANNMLSIFVLDSKFNVKGKKRETYNIVSQFDYLSSVDKVVMEKYDEYRGCCINSLNHWNKFFPRLKNHKENMVVSDTQVFTISKSFNSIWHSWFEQANQKEFSMEINSKYLIEPMLKEMVRLKKELPASQITNEILEDVGELNLIFQQWSKNKEGYSNIFNDLADTISRSYEQLQKSCDSLKNG